MSLNKDIEIFFNGKRMTLGEFIEKHNLTNESEETIQMVLDKMEKKGDIRYLSESEEADKAFERVAKELGLDAEIAQMEEDAESYKRYKVARKRENELKYEKLEIDLANRAMADEMYQYVTDKLMLEAEVLLAEDTGVFTIEVYGATRDDLSAIKRKQTAMEAGYAIFAMTDKVADTAIKGVAFAADKVVVPTAKAGLKTIVGLTKTLAKTTTAVGSSLITSSSQGARSMAKELKKDEDVLRAKRELVDAKDAIVRLFNRKGKPGKGIRVK